MRTISISTLLLILFGCAGAPRPQEAPKTAQESSIDIHYVLGHESRRLLATGTREIAEARSYVGEELFKGSSIDRDRYRQFLSKTLEVLQGHGGRTPTSDSAASSTLPQCGNPFSILLKSEGKSWILRGCRSQDRELSGAVSRLIREGEFLLFSKI